ncbi:hypothetical protein AB0C34_17050 [Nocardia sp. NPDC049220]|uniref:hypothetical protein n=1 Tax=Nocardia sp. NPDC049220 TaxID=3155273 RepID=UPI0033E1D1D8
MTTTETSGADRIRAAQAAVSTAQAAFEQIVRDEHADGVIVSDIAEALGDRKRRQRVYGILGRGENGDVPTAPAPQPIVYLRGPRQSDEVWQRVEAAMWARGWRTVRDRTTAWHLARGGSPVVLCDFAADFDGLAVDWIVIGRVRARYEVTTQRRSVADLLMTADRARAIQQGAPWLDEEAHSEVRVMDLPLTSGGRVTRPRRGDTLDTAALARLVAAAFAAV